MKIERLRGFTLAEILITLAIIGVVAAMTIPTLIAKINSIVTDNQQKVFNAKLIKGLNLTKTAGDLNNTYNSTYDFLVNGLSKNLKMAKICDSNHIRDCIPYDKIKYDDEGTEKIINVNNLKTVRKINLKTPYMNPAAFVLADGTPVIASYNKQCISDPDKADTTINACLAGIYDLNGTRKPNKYSIKIVMKDGAAVKDNDGKNVTTEIGDLRGFNGAYIGSSCFGKIGNLCIVGSATGGSTSSYEEMLAEIQSEDPNYSMPTNIYNNDIKDYWQLAKDYCNKIYNGAHLPSSDDLIAIAKVLYDNDSITEAYTPGLNMTNKTQVYTALGIDPTTSTFTLWANYAQSHGNGGARYFTNTYVDVFYNYSRNNTGMLAVCIK